MWGTGRQHLLPQLRALVRLGRGERDVAGEPPAQRGVDARVEVRGQDHDAAEALDPLEQVVDLEVRVAIGRGLDLGRALREQRVGLVEQQQRVARLGGLEHLGQLLLRLADPLRDDLRQVDLIELELELACDQTGDHRLAGAGWSREQRRDARAARQLLAKAPAVEDEVAVADAPDQRLDVVERIGRQHQLAPVLLDLDPASEVAEALRDVVLDAGDQVRHRGRARAAVLGVVLRRPDRGLDAAGAELVAVGQEVELRRVLAERDRPQLAARRCVGQGPACSQHGAPGRPELEPRRAGRDRERADELVERGGQREQHLVTRWQAGPQLVEVREHGDRVDEQCLAPQRDQRGLRVARRDGREVRGDRAPWRRCERDRLASARAAGAIDQDRRGRAGQPASELAEHRLLRLRARRVASLDDPSDPGDRRITLVAAAQDSNRRGVVVHGVTTVRGRVVAGARIRTAGAGAAGRARRATPGCARPAARATRRAGRATRRPPPRRRTRAGH